MGLISKGRAVAVVVVVIMAVLACGRVCEAREDTNELAHSCNLASLSLGNMLTAWARAIGEAVDRTPNSGFWYKAQNTVGGSTVWAIAACNGRLQRVECTRCLGSAMNQLSECYNNFGVPSLGAQIQLVDCRARWETYDFNW